MIIGLIGQAGSGKDSIAEMIAPVHFVELDRKIVDVRTMNGNGHSREALRSRAIQIAFADPLKEYCAKVYDFSLEQLWGPSEARNRPDKRYPRRNTQHAITDERCRHCGLYEADCQPGTPCVTYLTAREALQLLGTEWGRRCYADTWVEFALRRAAAFTEPRARRPDTAHGPDNWVIEKFETVVISDCRFVNEARVLHAAGEQVWHITRPGLDTAASMYQHVSETEQRDEAAALAELVTHSIVNDGTLDDLYRKVQDGLREVGL